MTLADHKVVLYRQLDGAWVAEVPAVGGCYPLMDTREAALAELHRVFRPIAEEHGERGQALPVDTTQIVHAWCYGPRFPPGCRGIGFVGRRQTGSHERWIHPDGRSVTIPLHGGREVGPPLYFRLVRDLGLAPAECDRMR